MDVARPVPRDTQVLVKVLAASANALDWRPLTFPPLVLRLMGGGAPKPRDKSFGADLAGVVESVGAKVTQFKAGDAVFGVATGSFAEYACAEEIKIALKPANVPFDLAAATPIAGCTALQALRDKGKLQPGQDVLIYGASGGVGTFAVQIAKFFKTRVTAVCSTRNVDMARSIGADETIDYTKQDFTKSPRRYDLIIAVNGSRPILHYWRALKPAGSCVVLGGSFAQIVPAILLGPLISRTGRRRMQFMAARSNQKDLLFLSHLLDQRKVVPVIDKRYPLAEVPQAMVYLIEEHPQGKVIITP
jgi:NADPH:quinone reductase-like Zn-dependent oxidoreductase